MLDLIEGKPLRHRLIRLLGFGTIVHVWAQLDSPAGMNSAIRVLIVGLLLGTVTLPVTLAVPLSMAVSLAWLVRYESGEGPVFIIADPDQSGR